MNAPAMNRAERRRRKAKRRRELAAMGKEAAGLWTCELIRPDSPHRPEYGSRDAALVRCVAERGRDGAALRSVRSRFRLAGPIAGGDAVPRS